MAHVFYLSSCMSCFLSTKFWWLCDFVILVTLSKNPLLSPESSLPRSSAYLSLAIGCSAFYSTNHSNMFSHSVQILQNMWVVLFWDQFAVLGSSPLGLCCFCGVEVVYHPTAHAHPLWISFPNSVALSSQEFLFLSLIMQEGWHCKGQIPSFPCERWVGKHRNYRFKWPVGLVTRMYKTWGGKDGGRGQLGGWEKLWSDVWNNSIITTVLKHGKCIHNFLLASLTSRDFSEKPPWASASHGHLYINMFVLW